MAVRFREVVADRLQRYRPELIITFLRTLRLPDDGKTYPLPPGLGIFPLRQIEEYSRRVPEEWLRRGGVLMPMYQAEALWLSFGAQYAFALKVSTGMVNASSGRPWFDYYRDDLPAIKGSPTLAKLKSIFSMAKNKGDDSIPQEKSVTPGPVKPVGPHAPKNVVAEWDGQ